MLGIVLDATVLIDVLRGRRAADRVRELSRQRLPLLTTAINVEEVVRGLRPSEQHAADALFSALHVLAVKAEDGARAGAWRREHAARGMTLRQDDCLVAACAAGVGARLGTANIKDFPLAEVEVELWPVGS